MYLLHNSGYESDWQSLVAPVYRDRAIFMKKLDEVSSEGVCFILSKLTTVRVPSHTLNV